MKWIPYGPNAWLLRFAERLGEEAFAHGRAIAAELERRPPPGLVEFVPAFTSVLLEFDPRSVTDPDLAGLAAQLAKAMGSKVRPAPLKEIPVVYDGPDLERVAKAHGLKIDQVGKLHSAPVYKVYMLGFSPGFPYLGELDKRLHTPRLSSPRARVPAGSVAIGGEHTGIYPTESPGGWNLIGRTTVKLFDTAGAHTPQEDAAMFFLKAGDRVKFVTQLSPEHPR